MLTGTSRDWRYSKGTAGNPSPLLVGGEVTFAGVEICRCRRVHYWRCSCGDHFQMREYQFLNEEIFSWDHHYSLELEMGGGTGTAKEVVLPG
jgi:hypothetical protein